VTVENLPGSGPSAGQEAAAGERYLLLADISGYTGFLSGVEVAHGLDFSDGIPGAYKVLADLLDTIIAGLEPELALVKLEGDAVFAAAPAATLDGQGEHCLEHVRSMYRDFIAARTRAIPAADHVCTACPAVAHLDLKVMLHRGPAVRQVIGSGSDLLGPAVNVAHRLLKNTVRDRIGARPYLFVTDVAATGLGVSDMGLAHVEDYPDVGTVSGRIVALGEPITEGVQG
jgi:class 3 adenylate cyclase